MRSLVQWETKNLVLCIIYIGSSYLIVDEIEYIFDWENSIS